MSGKQIELQVVCSNQVKSHTSTWVGNTIPWKVDITQPFAADTNYGRLANALNIYAVCELCHYSEGVIGDVIDHSKTPEELGYRPRMAIYLRMKAGSADGKGAGASGTIGNLYGVKLTAEEDQVFRKLKLNSIPNMTPDDPCPLCNRVQSDEGSMRSMRKTKSFTGAAGNSGNYTSATSTGTDGDVFKLRPEVGIQCGIASRLDDPRPVTIQFGTGSRLQPNSIETFHQDSGSASFPVPVRGGGTTSAAGNNFLHFDDTISDLKLLCEKLQRERDQLALELKDMTRLKLELEQWRSDHRCDSSEEVTRLRKEMDVLQCNLRDLMRGREEVFSLLHQRRTAGSMYRDDTAVAHAPFVMSVPSLEATPRNPRELLSRDLSSPTTSTNSPVPGRANVNHDLNSSPSEKSPVRLAKGPSAARHILEEQTRKRMKASDDVGPAGAELQADGQCLLQIQSVSGGSFFVKRLIGSQIFEGKNLLLLSSLDGLVTDEIFVNELELAAVGGKTQLLLGTKQHEWALYLSSAERQKWLHWLYALNPWLSAQQNTVK